MKRAYVLLLALLLLLTGCTGKGQTNHVTVRDVCCPYEIDHTKGVAEITLQDGEKSGILWQVQVIPDDVCEVTQEDPKDEYTSRYLIVGKEAGAAKLTFSALRVDDTVAFDLTLIVNVDSEGKAAVASYEHRERTDTAVEADGLNYKWNVDVDGILTFSFINSEDTWSVRGDGEEVCVVTDAMSTPIGCRFSAQAGNAGQTSVLLVGDTTQREILVTIQADDDGKLEVVSVQEQ